MRKTVLVFSAFLWPYAAPTQELLECVAPDVLEGLIRTTAGIRDAALSAEIPTALADVPIPGELDWIAAIVDGPAVTGVFKTDLSTRDALATALGALARAGWRTEEAALNNPPPAARGAVSAPPTYLRGAACRVRGNILLGGNVMLEARNVGAATYVTYNIASSVAWRGCLRVSVPSLREILNVSAHAGLLVPAPPGLESYVPELPSPVDPATGLAAVVFNLGWSAGGTGYETHETTSQLSIALPLVELAAYVGQHFADSGWVSDRNWAGAVSAGSTWTRETDSRKRLVAVLDVVALSGSSFDVRVRVVQHP